MSISREKTRFPTADMQYAFLDESNDRDVRAGDAEAEAEKTRRLPVWTAWKYEMVACVLAVAAVLAITATLYHYRGKPNPQWPYGISINTLLAIYTAVLKGALVLVLTSSVGQLQWSWFASPRPLIDIVHYNDARQGAWGALQWLWAHRLRQPLVAFGAAISIASIGIDPFTQQLLAYVDCSIEVTTPADVAALLPRTNYFRGHGVANVADGMTYLLSIEPALQSAINAGLFGSPYTVTATCSTGNCTFPQPYTTLGYCSLCEDISDRVTFNETCYTNAQNGEQTAGPCGSGVDNAVITSRLPSIVKIIDSDPDPENFSVTWDDTRGDPSAATIAVTQLGFDAKAPQPYSEMSHSWAQVLIGKSLFSVLRRDPATEKPLDCNNSITANTWQCQGYGAAQCTLQPCVREYSAAVVAGELRETLVTASDFTPASWGVAGSPNMSNLTLAQVDVRCLTAEEKATLIREGYTLNDTTRWLPYNVSDSFRDNPAADPLSRCVFAVDEFFHRELYNLFLNYYFNGTITVYSQSGSDGAHVFYAEGPQALQALYNMGNYSFSLVQTTFNTMSDSMTAYIRTAGQDSMSTPARGIVMHYTTCISIKWPFLTLPAVLVLMTLALFVLTVAAARGQPTWKDSPLAVVFHGPGSEAWTANMKNVNGLDDTDVMEGAAKEVVVKLTRSDTVTRLVTINEDVSQRDERTDSQNSW